MNDPTGLFWINKFNAVHQRIGVHSLFIQEMKRQVLWREQDYYCAKSADTPSTAITRERFEATRQSGGAIYLGVYNPSSTPAWSIYLLDQAKLAEGFSKKERENTDSSRLNLDESMGKEVL